MDFRLLGAVQAWSTDGQIPLGGWQRRALLALLLLHANRTVTVEQLTTLLWGERKPPRGDRRGLQVRVSQLRRLLDEVDGGVGSTVRDRLVFRAPGYRLRVAADELDLHHFDRLVGQARERRAAGDPGQAAELLRQALALWRGPALEDVAAGCDMLVERQNRLEQRRLSAVEDRVEADLLLARHGDLVAELTELVAGNPLRQRLRGQLMLALSRCGQPAEALAVFHEGRRILVSELGLEPGPDLQRLQREILAGGTSPRPAAQPPVPEPRRAVRFTLPADTITFIGRTRELAGITAVTDAARQGGAVAIHAIDGMPGVGKTALAIHAAHELAGRFPDRQVFIDLHAHTPDQPPTAPADALADLLIADGVDPRHLPDSLDGRAAMWRDRLAGSRTLVVLDNAASTDQITPLLPGTPGCLVLVTSRRQLADLTATHLLLDLLPAIDAVAMFTRLAPRAESQADAVKDVVEVCGHLPLAIAIIASLYTRHPTWTLTQLVAEIRGRRLTAAGEQHTVEAAFDLSYHHLTEPRQRFFRLLGLHPGSDIDGYAAAALTGVSYERALEELDALNNDHLLGEPTYRRYRMHDLVRDYAHAQATIRDPPEMRDQALANLLDYYQHTATRADAYLTRHTRSAASPTAKPAAAPELNDRKQAAAWLRTERANLLACIHHTTTHRLHEHTVGLSAGIAALLRTDGPWSLATDLHHTAASIARQSGDQRGHANALHDLCIARRLAGNYPGAVDLLGQALSLYRAIGDRLGHANTVHELGTVRSLTGDYPGAADLLGQALWLYHAIGDRRGNANTLHELGVVRYLTGDYPGAADLLGRALNLHRVLRDQRGQATALRELGRVRRLTGDASGAANLLDQALKLYQAIGNRRGQAITLSELGIVRRLTGNPSGAADLLRQALNLHRAIGNRHDEGNVLTQLAAVRYVAGDYPSAEDLLRQALTILREVGAPHDEAETLNHIGTLHRLTERPEQARAFHRQALAIARVIRHRLAEAHALEGIGRAAIGFDDATTALVHLRQALEIYHELGVPEATQLTLESHGLASSRDGSLW
jgi:DNA-binding SARP family transcriptional activator/tetratricopeptide (TPR) repeat protein